MSFILTLVTKRRVRDQGNSRCAWRLFNRSTRPRSRAISSLMIAKVSFGSATGMSVAGTIYRASSVKRSNQSSSRHSSNSAASPPVEQASGLPVRRERLDRDLHILVSHGLKIAQAHSRNVVQGKVWIDQHQSIRVAHEVSAFLSEFFHQASAPLYNLFFRLLAENRVPMSNRPRPRY